ncbi:MAG TPA: FGGY family carbohydrate kinase [Terriglobia bacterium]|nr:FGGY family carbohydrate kinase [Terriglobia bacterium]
MELVMGIDLGISVSKAGIFGTDGRTEAVYSEEYRAESGHHTGEADPENYWGAVTRAVAGVLTRWGGEPSRIKAVAASTHGEALFFLDANGRPTRPTMIWSDARAVEQSEAMLQRFGAQKLLEITGQTEIAPIYPALKIAWLRHYEPDVFARTTAYLLPADYLNFRLCGEISAEYSLWSDSYLLDIRARDWNRELLGFSGLREGLLTKPVNAGVPLGRVSEEAARQTGLAPGTFVVSGAIDQICAALAVGNVKPGVVSESSGSVLALLATTECPVFDTKSHIPCFLHGVPGRYCLLPWAPTAGLTLQWFRSALAQAEVAAAEKEGKSPYELICEQAALVPAGSEGLVMIPHLNGNYYPEACPEMRGVYAGIGLAHGKPHMVRALLEGVAYVIRQFVYMLREERAEVDRLHSLGGGSRSPVWSQIKADVCGIPVVASTGEEAAALGAGILAAVGCGLYASVDQAEAMFARTARVYEPRKESRAIYDQGFQRFQMLYELMNSYFRGRRP